MSEAKPAAATPSAGAEPEADREIVSTRLLPFSRAQVYAAFADPQRLARWWGPTGFTNTFDTFDLRPGGAWRFTMHGPNGADYPNESEFVEVKANERIVFKHICAPIFEMAITLAEHEGRTLLRWRMLFKTRAMRDQLQAVVVPSNEQNFDRLEAELAA